MALSSLEKALATALGLEIYKSGTTIALSKKAVQAAFVLAVKSGQIVGRQALPIAARGLPPVARAIANPYVGVPLAAAAGTYGLQQYLEESGQQEAQNVRVAELMRFLEEDVPKAGKKRKSVYNKAMAKAMKAVKASAKGGPKGKFTNAKKTFGQVSKAVSKASKGGKLSTKGVTGVIKRSISGLFKPKAKRRTSTKPTYTFRTN